MGMLELVVAGGFQTAIIPIVAALVGYGTNAVAVKMMFEPIEFVGVKPYLGWQGLVPASAEKLALNAIDLILGRLFTVRDLLAGFDPEQMAKQLAPVLDRLTHEVVEDVFAKHAPELSDNMDAAQDPDQWENYLDSLARNVRHAMLRAEIERTAVDILRDLHEHAEQIIDLREVVMTQVAHDKAMISDIFLTVGRKEFSFVKASGLYFGLPFGLLQMLQWVLWPVWWTLPLAGFAVGYLTNWIAVKLIFHPKRPIRIGPFILQGLFHKRQQEVSAQYAEIVARNVVNPGNIVRTISSGTQGRLLFAIVRRHMGALLDRYEKDPTASALFPPDARNALRADMFARVESELPKPGGFLVQFAENALDLQGELLRRMAQLDADGFEDVLRPAFREDEWKLVVVGGILGLAAGFLQLLICFNEAWSNVEL